MESAIERGHDTPTVKEDATRGEPHHLSSHPLFLSFLLCYNFQLYDALKVGDWNYLLYLDSTDPLSLPWPNGHHPSHHLTGSLHQDPTDRTHADPYSLSGLKKDLISLIV